MKSFNEYLTEVKMRAGTLLNKKALKLSAQEYERSKNLTPRQIAIRANMAARGHVRPSDEAAFKVDSAVRRQVTKAAESDDPKKVSSHVANVLNILKDGIGSRLSRREHRAAVMSAIQNVKSGKRTGVFPEL
jgi:hypothetical protein